MIQRATPELSGLSVTAYPSQAMAAAFVNLRVKFDRKVGREPQMISKVNFSLSPLYNINFTSSHVSMMAQLSVIRECPSPGGSDKLH